jgi:hypothetical protein
MTERGMLTDGMVNKGDACHLERRNVFGGQSQIGMAAVSNVCGSSPATAEINNRNDRNGHPGSSYSFKKVCGQAPRSTRACFEILVIHCSDWYANQARTAAPAL